MEGFEANAKRHDVLKLKFLSGEINQIDFLDILLDWDQSESSHAAASDNLKLLEDPDVRDIFLASDYESEYFDRLSFFNFHQGQALELSGQDGLEFFSQALEFALKVRHLDDGGDWVRYVQSTVAYLKNDIDTLKKSFTPGDLNERILSNFIAGLEQRGKPDYLSDYSKE